MEEDEQNATVAEPRSPPFADAEQPASSIGVIEAATVQDSIAPAEGISKRQRRPNVRLNEIGTNVLECLLKHKGSASNKSPSPLHILYPKSEGRIASSRPSTSGQIEKKNIVTANGGSNQAKVTHSSRYCDEIRRTKPTTFPAHETSSCRYMHHRDPEGSAEHFTHDVQNWMEVQGQTGEDAVVMDMKDDNHAGSSFRNDLAEGPFLKRKKKKSLKMSYPMGGRHMAICEEKEEPSSSGVQELRQQVPLWERGIAPLDEKVREWLCNLGLSKYLFLFLRHEVGDDVLPLLTMDDLREIGITAVGARRKIYSEIMKLRKEKGLISEDAYTFG